MREELISFKVAKLAKEKGFMFTEPDQLYYNDGGHINRIHISDLDFPAPTQSLLQRWLREKHKILLTVEYSLDKDDWFYYLYKQPFNKYIHFNTYEQALKEGLKQALTLIE